MNKIVAIIPARGGSKGLPRKNVLPLNGKPLIYYSIRAALDCPLIDKCVVSTDDSEIKHISLNFGAEVVHRPPELATDEAPIELVIEHVLNELRSVGYFPDYFVLLQPTSPLRNAFHVQVCLEEFLKSSATSAISVTETHAHPFKSFYIQNGTLIPFYDVESLSKPRQVLPKIYTQNGAIYVTSCKAFLDKKTLFVPPVKPFIMSPEDSVDIDTIFDFKIASFILQEKERDS